MRPVSPNPQSTLGGEADAIGQQAAGPLFLTPICTFTTSPTPPFAVEPVAAMSNVFLTSHAVALQLSDASISVAVMLRACRTGTAL